MSGLKAGDAFPEGIEFPWVPYAPESGELTSCGIATKYDASTEFKNKKVILTAVPGAFTRTCQERHLVSYIQNQDKLKAKGVDQVVFIAYNDEWVMSAWGKANGVKDDFIVFVSDWEVKFSKSIGWANGIKAARYAIVVDHGKVIYAEKDVQGSIDASGAEGILAKL